MRRGIVAFIALALIGLGVTGCGLFRFEQRDPWRARAEEACLTQGLVQPTAYMSRASAIDGPGACGISYPFKVAAFGDGSVGLNRQATLACPIIPTIDVWLNDVVQPAASLYFGTSVADVKSGSYSCRPRNARMGAKLSEHAFGNALDVMGFRLVDGREVTVAGGWRGRPAEREFLREVFAGACRHFTTVLGPGSDAFHSDHFHLDLARHDPRGQRRVCKPVLNFTSRLVDYARARPNPSQRDPAWRSSPALSDIDLDEDRDHVAAGRGRGETGRMAPPSSAFPPDGNLPRQARSPLAPLYNLPEPRPPAGLSAPLPPMRPNAAAPPLPVRRALRGEEPIPPYEPPPAQRHGPVVLQPQLWTGRPAY
jgi:hypothetical protein